MPCRLQFINPTVIYWPSTVCQALCSKWDTEINKTEGTRPLMGFTGRQGSIECYGISLEQPLALPWRDQERVLRANDLWAETWRVRRSSQAKWGQGTETREVKWLVNAKPSLFLKPSSSSILFIHGTCGGYILSSRITKENLHPFLQQFHRLIEKCKNNCSMMR